MTDLITLLAWTTLALIVLAVVAAVCDYPYGTSPLMALRCWLDARYEASIDRMEDLTEQHHAFGMGRDQWADAWGTERGGRTLRSDFLWLRFRFQAKRNIIALLLILRAERLALRLGARRSLETIIMGHLHPKQESPAKWR